MEDTLAVIVGVAERVAEPPPISEIDKLVFVEAFVAELAGKAFNIAVLSRLAWRDVAMTDLRIVHPTFQC
jgi:hypothetical protein